uniref:Putative flightin n=1 Tax=Corethrella appendiculata TaxID=1370023 RepID=U5EF38_9DIPT
MDDGAGDLSTKTLSKVDDFQKRKVQLYQHWVRPKFLQYNYMYNYRQNYYDDVIDYLDKRQRGIHSDIPKPQTWAERVLRQQKTGGVSAASCESYRHYQCKKDDKRQVNTLSNQINSHNYHSRAYTFRKYSRLL